MRTYVHGHYPLLPELVVVSTTVFEEVTNRCYFVFTPADIYTVNFFQKL